MHTMPSIAKKERQYKTHTHTFDFRNAKINQKLITMFTFSENVVGKGIQMEVRFSNIFRFLLWKHKCFIAF